ncbi:MAG: hypothetical protein ACYS9X_05810 [Planctomycetota bacterium]|jgi:hypothetical protein
MEEGERKVGAGTWVLAGLWAALLAGAPVFLARARRGIEDMGCYAVGREATTPFSLSRHLATRDMALPWPTGVALGLPTAVWFVLAAAIPALLVMKARRLPRGAGNTLDVLAAAWLVATLGFLIAARAIPLMVMVA